MVEMRVGKHDRLNFFRRDVHWKTNVVVDHHAVVKNQILFADTDSESGPAYFLAGAHEPDLHTNTEPDRY